jgi:tetratricopeptide (TPR) repeat protein
MRGYVLAALMLAAVLSCAGSGWTQDAPVASPAPPSGAKVIRDPAEYNAYVQALNQTDPAQHAAGMEAFVAAYPDSVAKVDALQQAMAAYQRAGNGTKVVDTARRLLDADPNNLRALAILTTFERAGVTRGDAAQVKAMGEHASKGLAALAAWSKPANMSDDDYKALHNALTAVFEGAHGFALLQAKDFDGARRAYLKALAIDPSDIQNAYQIGVAEMQTKPLRVGGFWWLAKAVDMAGAQHNDPLQQAVGAYAKAKYVRYHGSDDGWDAILVDATTEPKPPDDFSVKAAPSN